MKLNDVLDALSDGPAVFVDVRGVDDRELKVPAKTDQKTGQVKPARNLAMRTYFCEYPKSGKQIQVTEWPERGTNALPAITVARGQKVIMKLRSLGQRDGILTADLEEIIAIEA